MPEVVMMQVLGELDFPAVHSLRKTCHHLRNFIDDVSWDPKIYRTVILVNEDSIDFKLNYDAGYEFWPTGSMIRIKYEQSEGSTGTLVTWFRDSDRKEKILENLNFVDVFCADFEVIMRQQQSEMQDFILNFEYFPFLEKEFREICGKLLPSLENSLKNRPRPLLVRDFYMVALERIHVFQILPLLDSKSIRRITVTDRKSENRIWDFSHLEQWKNCKELDVIDSFVEKAGIQNFGNFKRIYIGFEEITMEDVMAWKQLFFTNSAPESFKIRFTRNTAESSLITNFGPPTTNFDQFGLEQKSWYFEDGQKSIKVSFINSSIRVERTE